MIRRKTPVGSPARPRESHLEAVAYHEAGHAVARHLMGIRLGRVTIKADAEAGNLGSCSGASALHRWSPEVDTSDECRMRMEREVVVNLAGHEAEFYFTGRRNLVGARSDMDYSAQALHYFTSEGEGNEEFLAYFKLLQLRTRGLVRSVRNWPRIQGLARSLLERETLTGKEARAVMLDAYASTLPPPIKHAFEEARLARERRKNPSITPLNG